MQLLKKRTFESFITFMQWSFFHYSSNERTLRSYNLHALEYIKYTPQTVEEHTKGMRDWIDKTLELTPKKGVIFEIGSATVRDASYMRKQNYQVVCSDATINFVRMMRKNGENALFFNVLNEPFPDVYSTIYANGVLSHFTVNEVRLALKNIHKHLTKEGILSFSIKYGVGEGWITEKFEDKRFTHFWSEKDIKKVLNDAGFDVIFENTNAGTYPSHRWLNLVCRLRN